MAYRRGDLPDCRWDSIAMANRLVQLELFHLKLPFRRKFAHAAADRKCTHTVVAAALLADGTVGFGEGVPREYVTGETVESVLYHIADCLVGCLDRVEPRTFADLLDLAESLPFRSAQNATINTARCCVELALLDAYGKHFGCGATEIAGWMGCGVLARRGRAGAVAVSGVLDGSEPARLGRQLRLMRLYGLRDFKVKLGCEHDATNLRLLERRLGSSLRLGRTTLRADANGAWDVDTALGMCDDLRRMGFCCVEQPLSVDDRDHWRTLADLSALPLMADESVVSLEDAEYLAANDLVDYFNIRISKNGGLLAAVRIAELAAKGSRGYQLGAMVGESGILAAAGRQFLQMVPGVSFTEICYGTFLLEEDIVTRKMRFGYGGRLPSLAGAGLGVEVRRERILKFLAEPARKIDLA